MENVTVNECEYSEITLLGFQDESHAPPSCLLSRDKTRRPITVHERMNIQVNFEGANQRSF